MNQKQIILNFQEDALERIKKKCATEEKRSLTAQMRIIIEKIPKHQDILKVLKSIGQSLKQDGSTIVKTAVKIPEDEFWSGTEKAAQAFLPVSEFCEIILELWERKKLPIASFAASHDTATGEKQGLSLSKTRWEGASKRTGRIERLEYSHSYTDNSLQIRWKINHSLSGDLWVVFVKSQEDSSEMKLLGEFCLGPDSDGEATFSSKILGFTPSLEKPQLIFIERERA